MTRVRLVSNNGTTQVVLLKNLPKLHPNAQTLITNFAYPGKTIECFAGQIVSEGNFVRRSYNWYKSDDISGTNSTLIRTIDHTAFDDNLDFYTVQNNDVGKFLSCICTYIDTIGTIPPFQVDWNPYNVSSLVPPGLSSGQFSPGYMPVMTERGTIPTSILITGFNNVTNLTGNFILQDHGISDGGFYTMANPCLWDTGNPQSTIDWGFTAVAQTYLSRIGGNLVEIFMRTNHHPPVLISPSFCVGAAHYPYLGGTGLYLETDPFSNVESRAEWLTPNNTPVTGNYLYPSLYSNVWYPGKPGLDDLYLFKLDHPITGVTPAGILRDSTKVHNKTGILLENDRHISAHIIQTGIFSSGTLAGIPITDDISEDGDSGMPFMIIISGKPILLGCIHGGNPIQISDISTFIPELTSIMSPFGEQLTIYDLP